METQQAVDANEGGITNTYRIQVPWNHLGTPNNDTSPVGWPSIASGLPLSTHVTPGETVAAVVARVVAGDPDGTVGLSP